MSNIIDYIKWRGDLTFSQDPFNEIDNLILSQLVYVELNNIVSDNAAHAISLLDASKNFFKQNNEQDLLDHVSMTKNAIFVLKEMAKSNRFKNAKLSRYVNDISEQEQSQFSAITIQLDDNSIYIAFSGTDATLVGWHEDFNKTDTRTRKSSCVSEHLYRSVYPASSGRSFQRWKFRHLRWNVL